MSADEEKTRVLQRRTVRETPPEVPGDKVVFYCPQGHRIVVDAAYAGKQGKCSKCGIDVRIPPRSEERAPGPPPPPGPAPGPSIPDLPFQSSPEPVVESSAEPAAGDAPAVETWDFVDTPRSDPPAVAGFESEAWPSSDAEGGLSAEGGNPTAVLVGRLWAERQHGGVIELHLAGGSVILPEWYDTNWSRGTHGLFASQAADGSVTLTAVAWETVQKIVVRQLTEVPNDMFT
ncbi:MAG: hypothetical protein ACKO1M_09615 [Planctomycetota bacterium]